MEKTISKQDLINALKTAETSKIPLKQRKILTPAAVLVPIIDNPKKLLVLFTKRTADLKNHAGQISFPGGQIEKNDISLVDTALRETKEEIGLDVSQIKVLGHLNPVISTTGFLVTPFVALITPPLQLTLDPKEVELTFTAPLNFLLDKNQQKQENYFYKDKNREIYVIEYEKHRIWGMTARILVELGERLVNTMPPSP